MLRSTMGRSVCVSLVAGAVLGLALALVAQISVAKAPGDKGDGDAPTAGNVAQPGAGRLAPQPSEAEAIEAALDKQVTCKFHDTPLEDVLASLAKQVDLSLELDPRGLDDAGVDRSAPITLEATLSLRSVLQLLEVRHHLGYVPGLGGLRITSEELAHEQGVVRVYPVKDLLVPTEEEDDVYRELTDAITSHIEPDQWSDNGGMGQIAEFGGCLTVRHTLAHHQQVANLLAAWRQVKKNRTAAGVKAIAVVPTSSGPAKAAAELRVSGDGEQPLSDFLDHVSRTMKVPLIVSLEGLESVGVDMDTTITGSYRDQPAGRVLHELLRPKQLMAVVLTDFVLITSVEEQAEWSKTRFYPVSDLLEEDKLLSPPGSYPFEFSALDGLQELIEKTIDPDSWQTNGGEGATSGVLHRTCLAVTTSDENHAEIERLLTSLREQAPKEAKEKEDADRIVQRTYPLYLARRQLKAQQAKPAVAPEAPAAPAIPAGSQLRSKPKALAQFGGGGMGGVLHEGLFRPQVTEPIPTADDVAELVRELLPDASWKEEGVLLKPFHDVLIVRQRPAMLRKVEKLLSDIDAWHTPIPMGGGLGGSILPVVGDKAK